MSTYPDVEAMLIAYLSTAISPAPGVSTKTPADPNAGYDWVTNGFIKVRRVGGPRKQGIDTARIILEFYALNDVDSATAVNLGNAVGALFDGPILACRNSGGVVIGAHTVSAPSWVPYDDVRVERYQSIHTLVVHSMK